MAHQQLMTDAKSSALSNGLQVVDMFGCGLPVCAKAFPCIGELVTDGQDGLLFSSPRQLAEQWQALLQGFPKQPVRLQAMAQQVQQRHRQRWQDAWRQAVLPVISSSLR